MGRGEYLERSVSHCGECHTPRTITMTMDNARFLAGNASGLIEGARIPNITPDKDTGIGDWTEEHIADFLATGKKPDGGLAEGLMGDLIQGTFGGYKDLTESDRRAIAQYLKSIPAVHNTVPR